MFVKIKNATHDQATGTVNIELQLVGSGNEEIVPADMTPVMKFCKVGRAMEGDGFIILQFTQTRKVEPIAPSKAHYAWGSEDRRVKAGVSPTGFERRNATA